MTRAEAFAGKMPFLPELGDLEDPAAVAEGLRNVHAAICAINRTIYGDARKMVRDRLPTIDGKVETAQVTADARARVFTAEPDPPYVVGDLWANPSPYTLKVCTTARASGEFNPADWTTVVGGIDDSTIGRNGSENIYVKTGGIDTLQLAANAVTVRFHVFEKATFQFAANYKYETVALVSGPVTGIPLLLAFGVAFTSTYTVTSGACLRLQYSPDGANYTNVWYHEDDPGDPNTAEPADEGDESNPYVMGAADTISLVMLHAHTPSAGIAYYRLQAKAQFGLSSYYNKVRSRWIAAFEFKR